MNPAVLRLPHVAGRPVSPRHPGHAHGPAWIPLGRVGPPANVSPTQPRRPCRSRDPAWCGVQSAPACRAGACPS
eukprot:9479651-Pyramimonas_sp.AAC.1